MPTNKWNTPVGDGGACGSRAGKRIYDVRSRVPIGAYQPRAEEGEFREIRRGGNAMIGPIGVYLLRFPGAVPHPKPPCEAGAAAGLVIQNVPPLLG